MTQEQLDQVIFIVKGKTIQETTYQDYLDEYGSDLTTSPIGVAEKLHIREVSDCVYEHITTKNQIWGDEFNPLDDEDQDNYRYLGESIRVYSIWTWGAGGNRPYFTGYEFETQEEAELYLYDCKEEHANYNCDAPKYFFTEKEAIEDLAEFFKKSFDVIERYLSIKAIRKLRIIRENEAATAANIILKKNISDASYTEASSITIDQEFIDAIKWASEAHGVEKSNRCASALKGLMQRIGKDKIDSDFWQVFRLLKSRIK